MIFPLTLFLSAMLMFTAESMVAKILLPILGGSPAVWNVCMTFFQLTLLAGYAYAWGLSRQSATVQLGVHLTLLTVSLFALPVALSPGLREWLAGSSQPELALIPALAAMVGGPFLMLSATNPLLQHWYARQARDPARAYRLYAASNAGSLIGLMGYPLILEPASTLPQQSQGWGWGYGLLVLLISALGIQTLRAKVPGETLGETVAEAAAPSWGARLRWLGLSALPCSLMLGVTSHVTSDLAAVPLLWTIPLAIYLGTLIVVFRQRTSLQDEVSQKMLPVLAVAVVYIWCVQATEPTLVIVGLHLALFGCIAFRCHARLVDEKPHPSRLTQYYLWIAAGGALGSLANALLAPQLFKTPMEYPLVLVAGLAWVGNGEARLRIGGVLRVVALGAVLALALWIYPKMSTVTIMAASVAVYFFKNNRLAFGAATILTLGIASVLVPDPRGKTIFVDRDFFGVSKVMVSAQGHHQITHGNTIHGAQDRNAGRERTPLLYYHRRGPFGKVFQEISRRPGARSIAVAGMGAGTMLAYSEPGQRWTFYEIDPLVVKIAQDRDLFSYVHLSAVKPEVILGDARLKLREAPDGAYDALIIDVFSSDSVPTHLLTREAVALYIEKIKPEGILAMHISNRSLDLLPVVAGIGAALGLECRSWDDDFVTPEERADGKRGAHVVVLHRPEHPMATLDQRWKRVQGNPKLAWTDDFSNIIAHLK